MDEHRILIAEDHTLMRNSLRLLLERQPSFRVVAEAADGLEALQRAREHLPDLIVMDISMPGMSGIEAMAEIRREMPDVKILAVTVDDSDENVLGVLEAGADGFCSKSEDCGELLRAMMKVLSGWKYISGGVAGRVSDSPLADGRRLKPRSDWESLTSREREILGRIAGGEKSREIADGLGLSIKTVQKHRANLIAKLGIRKTAELTAYFLRRERACGFQGGDARRARRQAG